eukprot:11586494-Ditylum_brightwellii.AAC.1
MVVVVMRPWCPVGATKGAFLLIVAFCCCWGGRESVLGGWGGGDGVEMHILARCIPWLMIAITMMMQISKWHQQ